MSDALPEIAEEMGRERAGELELGRAVPGQGEQPGDLRSRQVPATTVFVRKVDGSGQRSLGLHLGAGQIGGGEMRTIGSQR